MSPFQQFVNGLKAARMDMNEMLDELTAFSEVMARKSNSIEMDENGMWYVTASGNIEEVIHTIYLQLDKLERIKKQKDSNR